MPLRGIFLFRFPVFRGSLGSLRVQKPQRAGESHRRRPKTLRDRNRASPRTSSAILRRGRRSGTIRRRPNPGLPPQGPPRRRRAENPEHLQPQRTRPAPAPAGHDCQIPPQAGGRQTYQRRQPLHCQCQTMGGPRRSQRLHPGQRLEVCTDGILGSSDVSRPSRSSHLRKLWSGTADTQKPAGYAELDSSAEKQQAYPCSSSP